MPNQNNLSGKRWTTNNLQEILGGQWVNPPDKLWQALNVAIAKHECDDAYSENTLFIAMDEETWYKGSSNTRMYRGWTDTHPLLPGFQNKVVGAVVQRPIANLDPRIPQLLVDNSYEAIKKLGTAARNAMNGKIVAITGTVGKSTTKLMLDHLLRQHGTVVSTRGNHNSRTGVPLTLSRCISNPDYCVLEISVSALWMQTGSICNLARPHIGIITEMGEGHRKSASENAKFKSRICEGMVPGGYAVLNRDMEHYDIARQGVEEFGATAVSYGFSNNADVYVKDWHTTREGTWVTASIFGTEISYELPLPGKAMVANSLAALTTIHLLGLNVTSSIAAFRTLPKRRSVIELVTMEVGNGQSYLLDDSWNAQYLSLMSAFDVFKQQSSAFTGKKLAILGRIVDLGDKAQEMHQKLAKPLMQAGIDLVFAHGEEMKYLLKELPPTMVGGYFRDAKSCVQAVSNIIERDDFILLKGSRDASDFAQIRDSLIQQCLRKKNVKTATMVTLNTVNPQTKHYGAISVDAQSGEVLGSEGAQAAAESQGMGSLLLLSLLLENLGRGKIKLHDEAIIGNFPARDSRAAYAIGLREGDKVSVHTLLNAMVCHNAPDATLALAERLFGSTGKALNEIQQLAADLGISHHAVENITGRQMRNKPQKVTVDDLVKGARHLFANPPFLLKLLNVTTVTYKSKTFTASSNLIANGKANAGFMFGHNHSMGIAMTYANHQKIISIAIGARDEFHRDYLLIKTIEKAIGLKPKALNQPSNTVKLNADDEQVKINILGDTYFGEFYTQRRQKNNVEDALTKYGYRHSFNSIQPILQSGHYNIANFEAVLTELERSPLQGSKPFVLGGHPGKSVDTLKHYGIDAVTLGNNHIMDYGEEGLRTTLSALHEAGILTFGAGLNAVQAEKPLHISVGEKEIIGYNAYWYRPYMYQTFNFYAIGEEAGTACLNQGLIDQIQEERQRNPNAYIIFFAHWGFDFEVVQPMQRNYAKQLIEAGVDLIIGHGAHLMQEISRINNKWVLYGIGNGVFNSNGEYQLRHVPPYSFIAQLRFDKHGANKLFLYPIHSDNLKTFWQPCPVNEEQFQHVLHVQASFGTPIKNDEAVKTGRDDHGYYIAISL
ncbi:CapA family protein [Paenibacillus sp. J2TS4]|uniref:CapA family protein n=1 Tax=Paenibacillus sp. J2TS4 TaxID=2807194 RepID=UPI001B01C106|nr:CapA family protein [Paenibacillus sp. J2TS4]GIP35227.1 hypothetical protein J2TS4_44370 [Paenibacillus sp. J2TS4]